MACASLTGTLPQVHISGQFCNTATNFRVNIPYSRLVCYSYFSQKEKNIKYTSSFSIYRACYSKWLRSGPCVIE